MHQEKKKAGFVKIYRSILDNAISTNPAYFSLWIHLLLMANHRPKLFLWNNQQQECKPGQVLTGRLKLATIAGLSPSTVENILTYLENEQQIEQQKTTKFRLITIKNWYLYQSKEQQIGQQSNNRVTTEEQQNDTNKNERMNKNEEEESKIVAEATKISKKEKKECGNPEINNMLLAMKQFVGCTGFKESEAQQRIAARNLLGWIKKNGKDEFRIRLEIILKDEFRRRNSGSLWYLYKEIKGFVQQKNREFEAVSGGFAL